MIKAIADNTVLSNFALVEREGILYSVFDGALAAPEAAIEELLLGERKGIVPLRDWSWLTVLRIESKAERKTYAIFSETLGRGESSCLSLALSRNFLLLTDDIDARMMAHRRGVKVSGTIGVLVLAVKKKTVTLEVANLLLTGMIQKGYYSPYLRLDALVQDI